MNKKQISLSEQAQTLRRQKKYRESLLVYMKAYKKNQKDPELAHDFLELVVLNFGWSHFNVEFENILNDTNLIFKAIKTVKKSVVAKEPYYPSLRAKYHDIFLNSLRTRENNLNILEKKIRFMEITTKLFNNDNRFVTINTYLLLDVLSILAEHDKNEHNFYKITSKETMFFKMRISPLLAEILRSKTKPGFEKIPVYSIASKDVNVQERLTQLKSEYPEIAWVNKVLVALENSNREIKPVEKDLPQVSAEEAAG